MIGLRARARYAAVAVALSLAACGGGGGGSTGSVSSSIPASPATTAPITGPTGQVAFRIDGSTIATSSTARRSQYVSPSTQSATVSMVVGATLPLKLLATINISPTSASCSTTASGLSCVVSVPAPVGTDTFVVSTFDGLNGTGSQLSTATTVATILQNATNTVALALNGVLAKVAVILGTTSVQAGTPASVAVTVVGYDAQNNIIIGPGNYSTPVTLTNSDTTTATHLSASQVVAPGTTVTLNYTGGSTMGATITPAAGTATATAATFRPTGYGVSTFSVPSGAVSSGYMLASGPDGNVWFGSKGAIGNMTPSGAATLFTANLPDQVVSGLATGPDGALWYGMSDGELGSVTTSGSVTAVTSFSAPLGCGSSNYIPPESVRRRAQGPPVNEACGEINWVTANPADGRIWFADDNGLIGSIDPTTHAATEWDLTMLPGWTAGDYAEPEQLTFGSDGALYAADAQGLLDRIVVAGGTPTSDINIPLVTGCSNGEYSGSYSLTIDANGTIWSSDQCSNLVTVSQANFSSTAVSIWNLSGYTSSYVYCSAANAGGVWCSTFGTGPIYRITNAATPPSIAPILTTANVFPGSIAAGTLINGPDGNLWATGNDTNDYYLQALAKIAYGAPATGSTVSLKRITASAASHAARAGTQAHRLLHQPGL